MAAELDQPIEQHSCNNPMCRCASEMEFQPESQTVSKGLSHYCGSFCKDVEQTTEVQRCGCGHMACDATIQYGNEAELDRT